ncbi:hypothetical protein J3458_009209 [Metarhizium acridum]|uniref:uncharacterized protein n=1 Tax=Metarhizium acridum TaxID=92637 RepID=UPI001C6BDB3E|nr:hypothetical protein J3458_009209 [Metarhizium acridum]
MNIVFHLLNAAALAAAIDFSVIFPTSSPPASSEPEPSICAAENYTNYLIGPRPTGTLSSAMASYTSQLFKTCTLPLEEWLDCPFPESSRLCGFSTAGPSEVMSAYSGFGSLASSWWLTHSLAAEQIASSCPSRWYDEMDLIPFAAVKLKETISFAECFIREVTTAPSDGVSKVASTPSTAPKTSAAPAAKETGATESLAARWRQDKLITFATATTATWMLFWGK